MLLSLHARDKRIVQWLLRTMVVFSVRNYEDIVEQFFREAQYIVYCRASLQSKAKMLHGAHYRATYFLQLNNKKSQSEQSSGAFFNLAWD